MINCEFNEKFVKEGLTYDDVTLVTQYADFLPDDTSLETNLTSRVKMNIPFISAAMDTVTEANLAIAIAREGGAGTIHKNMTIDAQVDNVDRVKRSENGVISNPIFLGPDNYVYEAENLMRKFKTQSGYTLHQYITRRRILSAAELIGTGIPAAKAALRCGYDDYSAFLRAFKSVLGVSPRSFTSLSVKKDIFDE